MKNSNSILLAVLTTFAQACIDHRYDRTSGRNPDVVSQENRPPTDALYTDAEPTTYSPPQETIPSTNGGGNNTESAQPSCYGPLLYQSQHCAETNCAISGTLALVPWRRERKAQHVIGEKTYQITLTGLSLHYSPPQSPFFASFSVEEVVDGLVRAGSRMNHELLAGRCGDIGCGVKLMFTSTEFEEFPGIDNPLSTFFEADYCLIPPTNP